MTHQWNLYGTQGCHLCEKAKVIIQHLQYDFSIELTEIDITEGAYAEQWVERFGEHIPVLENTTTQALLYWPFCPEVLTHWLS
ncbi:glutaredoxin family protein [Marinagarivorans algicola]|uniref:glutaredoxin family protein n=1 Tax=Marinagarivorans algicola TaxID=1513270 RepID=UPI0006B60004|nr:glutaredoxin family protein [Marinagarivorans algicola]